MDDLLLQVDAALKDLKEHPKTVPASSPSEFEKLNEEESFEDALKDVRSATNAAPKDANLSVPSQSIVLTQSMMSSASMREGGEAREAREGPLRKSMSSNSLLRPSMSSTGRKDKKRNGKIEQKEKAKRAR